MDTFEQNTLEHLDKANKLLTEASVELVKAGDSPVIAALCKKIGLIKCAINDEVFEIKNWFE